MKPEIRIKSGCGESKERKHYSKFFFKRNQFILLETSFAGAPVLTAALGLHWAAGPAPSASVLFSFCNLGIFCCSKYN